MNVFFSDLDNTLIFSHRHHISEDKIVVEYLDGKEQSFMTRMTWNSLINLTGITLVPVSTRTETQYFRLICMQELHPKYAIICNGGKLLIDGKEDKLWTEETYNICSLSERCMNQAIRELVRISSGSEGHRPESYMYYTSVEFPQKVRSELLDVVDSEKVAVCCDSRKVYLFSKNINKGEAVRRFKSRFEVRDTIAAGDNEMDIPMLNEVRLALAAEGIYPQITAQEKIKLTGDNYSDQICKALDKYTKTGVNDD